MDAIKKVVSFGLAIMIIWGVIYGYNCVTDGFSIREMTSTIPYNPDHLTHAPTGEQRALVSRILDQEFRYIGKGCQFYAFESADKAYVIKFFKQKHLRTFDWVGHIPMPRGLRAKYEASLKRRADRIENLFSSCKLAFEELPHETGVLYLHLTRTPDLKKEITLIDKVGLRHRVELDQYEFVLQKRAIHVSTTFANLVRTHHEERAPEKVHQLVQLIKQRCEKGIRDRDRSFVQNVAFCAGEERAVFVDIGQFFRDESIKSNEEMAKDMVRRLGNLRHWIEQHYPALTHYIDEEIALLKQPQKLDSDERESSCD